MMTYPALLVEYLFITSLLPRLFPWCVCGTESDSSHITSSLSSLLFQSIPAPPHIHPWIFSSPLTSQAHSHPEWETPLRCAWRCEMEKERQTVRDTWRGILKIRWGKRNWFQFHRRWGRQRGRCCSVQKYQTDVGQSVLLSLTGQQPG